MDVGPYRCRSVIASGGNSTVFRAVDLRTARSVALKIRACAALPRLERELSVLRDLSHPCIVAAFEVGATVEHAYLALELVEGVRIDQLRDTAGITRTLGQLREALRHVHARGWVHADVHRRNVLVDLDGNVRLCDFGAATRIGEPSRTATIARYASPARRVGAPLSPADDLFSCDVLGAELTAATG